MFCWLSSWTLVWDLPQSFLTTSEVPHICLTPDQSIYNQQLKHLSAFDSLERDLAFKVFLFFLMLI